MKSDEMMASALIDPTKLNGYYASLMEADEDDTGTRKGKWVSPYGRIAKYLVARQPVIALGKRPTDWLKRDLLSGTTGDDPRAWFYRKTLKNQPNFLLHKEDQVLNGSHESVVRASRAFDYSHRHHLLKLKAECPPGTQEESCIHSALNCPTSLYETRLRFRPKDARYRRFLVCQQVWLCPHCYCRAVVQNYQLAEKMFAQSAPAFVVLVTGEIALEPTAFAQGKELLKKLREKLLDIAKSMGGTGGIWTQQVTIERQALDFWHDDELTGKSVDCLGLRAGVMAVIPKEEASLRRFRSSVTEGLNGEPYLRVDAMRFDPKKTLRSAFSRRPTKGMRGHDANLSQNDHGLFYWPLLAISNIDQWRARLEITANQPASRRWGSWSKQGSAPLKNHSAVESSQSAPINANTNSNIGKLAGKTKPVLNQIISQLKKIPGRVRLQKELAKLGFTVTEREVRAILIDYKANSRNKECQLAH